MIYLFFRMKYINKGSNNISFIEPAMYLAYFMQRKQFPRIQQTVKNNSLEVRILVRFTHQNVTYRGKQAVFGFISSFSRNIIMAITMILEKKPKIIFSYNLCIICWFDFFFFKFYILLLSDFKTYTFLLNIQSRCLHVKEH